MKFAVIDLYSLDNIQGGYYIMFIVKTFKITKRYNIFNFILLLKLFQYIVILLIFLFVIIHVIIIIKDFL